MGKMDWIDRSTDEKTELRADAGRRSERKWKMITEKINKVSLIPGALLRNAAVI